MERTGAKQIKKKMAKRQTVKDLKICRTDELHNSIYRLFITMSNYYRVLPVGYTPGLGYYIQEESKSKPWKNSDEYLKYHNAFEMRVTAENCFMATLTTATGCYSQNFCMLWAGSKSINEQLLLDQLRTPTFDEFLRFVIKKLQTSVQEQSIEGQKKFINKGFMMRKVSSWPPITTK